MREFGNPAKGEDIFDGIYRMDGTLKGGYEATPPRHFRATTETRQTETLTNYIHGILSIPFIPWPGTGTGRLSEKNA